MIILSNSYSFIMDLYKFTATIFGCLFFFFLVQNFLFKFLALKWFCQLGRHSLIQRKVQKWLNTIMEWNERKKVLRGEGGVIDVRNEMETLFQRLLKRTVLTAPSCHFLPFPKDFVGKTLYCRCFSIHEIFISSAAFA